MNEWATQLLSQGFLGGTVLVLSGVILKMFNIILGLYERLTIVNASVLDQNKDTRNAMMEQTASNKERTETMDELVRMLGAVAKSGDRIENILAELRRDK